MLLVVLVDVGDLLVIALAGRADDVHGTGSAGYSVGVVLIAEQRRKPLCHRWSKRRVRIDLAVTRARQRDCGGGAASHVEDEHCRDRF